MAIPNPPGDAHNFIVSPVSLVSNMPLAAVKKVFAKILK